MTSLNSGLPSRDTCAKGPLWKEPLPSSDTRTRWRLALVHTPIVGRPFTVRSEIGTWIAMECTFRRSVAFTPGAFFSPAAFA
jgi:hypothetical protein